MTSRLEDDLGEMGRTIVKPCLIEGGELSQFMYDYLTKCGKRDHLTNTEYFDACGQLSQMVGQQKITVLLAKLYADLMVLRKEHEKVVETKDFTSLPNNIPELMLSYLNEVNGDELEKEVGDSIVRQDCKAIAWQCLKQTYQPAPAKRESVLQAMSENDNADKQKRLEHLKDQLKVIQTIDSDEEQIRFTLDPLAEYLAGLHLIEQLGDNAMRWQQFLLDADTKPQTAIQGFLQAVYNCCLVQP